MYFLFCRFLDTSLAIHIVIQTEKCTLQALMWTLSNKERKHHPKLSILTKLINHILHTLCSLGFFDGRIIVSAIIMPRCVHAQQGIR